MEPREGTHRNCRIGRASGGESAARRFLHRDRLPRPGSVAECVKRKDRLPPQPPAENRSNRCAPSSPFPIRLVDYRPPDWLVETVDLDVSLDRDRDAGARGAAAEAQSEGRGPRPAGARRRRAQARRAQARRRSAGARPLCRRARQPHHRAAAAAAVHARDRDRRRSLRQHPAHGPLPLRRTPIAPSARPKAFAASPISPTVPT